MQVCGKSCETGEVLTLTVKEGRIAGILAAGADPNPGAETRIGGPDVWLAPGFHDLQVNGYGGYDFNPGAWTDASVITDSFTPMIALLAKGGTPLLCPTVYTDSEEVICAGLSALSRAIRTEPSLARAITGIHLEGPYISPEEGPLGAHPPQFVRPPDWEEFCRFQEAAEGRIKICTLAPELPGALAFIEKAAESGVVVAIGHTGAEPETIRDAARAGARMSTHLGNGAHAQIRRHPNYIWEQLAHDGLYASIIADGHHLPAAVIKSMARVKGAGKLALVSDAVSLGGLAPGLYVSGLIEVLPTGKIVLAGTPYLAGAGHLLDTCVANAIRFSDLTLDQAVRCASTIPARLLGLESRKGHLRVGYDADLTLFRVSDEGPLEIIATLCGGEVVFRAASSQQNGGLSADYWLLATIPTQLRGQRRC